jgi:hypothetical protein
MGAVLAKANETLRNNPGFKMVLCFPEDKSEAWFHQFMKNEEKLWRILIRFELGC